MRVLLSSTAGAGHFAPLLPFVDALARRGDEVLLVVPPGLEPAARATGRPYRLGEPRSAEEEEIWRRVPLATRDEASILVNREVFGRLSTAAMLPAVDAACREWGPDLVLHEAAEYAGPVAADRNGILHAQVAIGLAGIEWSSLALAAPVLAPQATGIVERIAASPYLSRLPASLDASRYPDTRRCREMPVASPGRSPVDGWWGSGDEPRVYVSFGTVAGTMPLGAAAYRAALDAVSGLPVRVLLTVGRTRELTELEPWPDNVHVEEWVDQDEVLDHADVVVCHGGAGTTFGALAAGVPLVVVPLMADQPANGRLVAAAGAGLVVQPDAGEVSAQALRGAIERLLADPGFGRAASRVGDEMRGLPSMDAVLATLAAEAGAS